MDQWQNIQLQDVTMIAIENSFVCVWIDGEIHLLHCEWKRTVSSKEYRQGHHMFINLLKKYSIKYWIVDSTNLGDISAEDEEWFMNTIMPEIIKTCVVKVARLSGENHPSYNRFENFSEKAKEANDAFTYQVEVRNCMTFKEAADWMGKIYN